MRASSIAESMVNKDELIKGYVNQSRKCNLQNSNIPFSCFLPSFEFMFSVFHMFPPSQKTTTSVSVKIGKASTKNTLQQIPAPPANLSSCRPWRVIQLLWGPKISQLPTLGGAPRDHLTPRQAARLSSISTKSQGLRRHRLRS